MRNVENVQICNLSYVSRFVKWPKIEQEFHTSYFWTLGAEIFNWPLESLTSNEFVEQTH
jgi:hypothetical protein